jgi:hypothetical protein
MLRWAELVRKGDFQRRRRRRCRGQRRRSGPVGQAIEAILGLEREAGCGPPGSCCRRAHFASWRRGDNSPAGCAGDTPVGRVSSPRPATRSACTAASGPVIRPEPGRRASGSSGVTAGRPRACGSTSSGSIRDSRPRVPSAGFRYDELQLADRNGFRLGRGRSPLPGRSPEDALALEAARWIVP